MSAFDFPEVSLSCLIHKHVFNIFFSHFLRSSVIVRSPTVMLFKLMCCRVYTPLLKIRKEKKKKLYWKDVETWNGPYLPSGVSFDSSACIRGQGAEMLPILQPIPCPPALLSSGPSFVIFSLLTSKDVLPHLQEQILSLKPQLIMKWEVALLL